MSNIQLFNPSAKSIEQCITEAYASFNVPSLGGASVDGWSKISDFMRCPYRYQQFHEIPKDDSQLVQLGQKPSALEIGTLYHATLACHYAGSCKPLAHTRNVYDGYPTALELVNRVTALGGDTAITSECERLYLAYFNHYGNPHDEGFSPLAIELPAGTAGVHTCRFDLLAERDGGTWIVEHKTASRETRDVLESWWLDGEIIGEVYGYKLSGLEKVHGPLVGVLVNVVIKTQVPKFRRIEVVIPDSLLERYAIDRDYWSHQRRAMQELG